MNFYLGVPGKGDNRFAAGFGGGFGTSIALVILTGAGVFVYFWARKGGY